MDSARERLVRLVAEARDECGLRQQEDLVRATGLSRSTVHRFEQGEPVSETTVRKISVAVNWTPESGQAVLAGGNPTLADESALASRYRRQPVEPGLSTQIVEDMVYKALIAAAPDTPLSKIDKARRAAFEVLQSNGIRVARRHPEASQGTETDS
jgi:transcriptional regulator with XRE-family HTH domain